MNTKVVRAIDAYLDNKGLKETTPVDVGPYLEKRGILKDSSSRPGKPLRDLLRKGQIPNAYQNGNRWVIRRSNFKSQLKGSKTEVEEQTPVSTFKKVTLPIDVESG